MDKNQKLFDAQEAHRNSPETFEVPSQEALAGLKVGDFVKIGFLTPEGTPIKSERMWVFITGVDPLRGRLNNDPLFIQMDDGDPVEFETLHVLDIIKAE